MNTPFINENPYAAGVKLTKEQIEIEPILKMFTTQGFTSKKEFHVSVFGRKAGVAILEKIKDNLVLKKKIEDLILHTDWDLTLLPEYFHIKREYDPNNPEDMADIVETRESIIQKANVPNLEKFFSKLNSLLSLNLPTQFPHVTLLTKDSDQARSGRGIAIDSVNEFNRLMVKQIFI